MSPLKVKSNWTRTRFGGHTYQTPNVLVKTGTSIDTNLNKFNQYRQGRINYSFIEKAVFVENLNDLLFNMKYFL
jgi:hypothetical protein